jgi:hypothetical protein
MTSLSDAYATAVNGDARSKGVRLQPLLPMREEGPNWPMLVVIGGCFVFWAGVIWAGCAVLWGPR